MKRQKFTSDQHEKFKEYFQIKNRPGEWDLKYMEKAEKYIKYISWIPGIMMVGIGNSMAMNSAKQSSDIDLYIVTKNNSMWVVRILVTLIFQLLGVRKTASKHAGRFCLSFFSTLDGMDFSSFALDQDIYLYFWIVYFKPIYNKDNTYERFIEANSSWADFSDFLDIKKINLDDKNNLELTWLDNIFKYIFLPKTKKSFHELWKPFGVVISDDVLKFHDKDIRKQVVTELL